ncbi:MAG: flagellar assembly protein FliW [Verrucomicrobiota bacterium]
MSSSGAESLTTSEYEMLNKAMEFPFGLPGFPEFKKFVFVQHKEERPFAWMRSLDDERIAFAVVEAYFLLPDFSFEIDDKELEEIGNPPPDKCGIFFIVKIDAGEKVRLTVDCHAPLIINTRDQKGRQVIVPSDKPEPTVFEY